MIVKLPPRKRVEKREEYGKELGGIVVCPTCSDIHYEKKWHHSENPIPGHLKSAKKANKICPACNMVANHLFEGELIIENIPTNYKRDLLNLINSFSKKANKRDPQDRIIQIRNDKSKFRVTTTENQLAVRLGKKVRDTFKSATLSITHAKEPAEVSRINIKF